MQVATNRSFGHEFGERLERPGWVTSFFFVLLLSGPPKFRFRDSEASLYGELDLATVVQIVVWLIAGIWLVFQVRKHIVGNRPRLVLAATHKWAALFILILTASISVSVAPAFSAFKVYQVMVLFGLGLVFVQRHGAKSCYQHMLIGLLLLCGLIVCFAFVNPDLVIVESETGVPRIVGRAIAETGIVTALGMVLLLCMGRKVLSPLSILGQASLGVLLFCSLTRSAYLVVALVGVMYLRKRFPGRRIIWPVLLLSGAIAAIVFVGLVPDFGAYRDAESVWTLSDRIGLWSHFIDRTIHDAPMLGFGFVAGGRVVGMEFEQVLGSGHSIFFEALVGGGFSALVAFLVLVGLMVRDGVWLFVRSHDRLAFAGVALLASVLCIGLIGGELDSGQIGFSFWMLVSLLPYLRRRAGVIETTQRSLVTQGNLRTLEQTT